MKKTFAQTLLSWRKKMKLNRVEASELLGVPYRTLQDWEGEEHTPGDIVQTAIRERLANVPRAKSPKSVGKRAPKK